MRGRGQRGEPFVSDTSSDSIVQRALAPLHDLSSIVFFRKANRDFVTGRGPIAARSGSGARAFMRGGMWLFLIGGALITLIVGAMEIERRQSGLTISMPAISRRARCCCSWRWFIGFLPGASRAGP